MPGLVAVVRSPGSPLEPLVDRMLQRMTHFPWFASARHLDPPAGVGIGAVWLKRTTGQPGLWVRGSTAVGLDGEIHDAEVERRRLEGLGVRLESHDPAELLAAGWVREGAAFLSRLNGAFTVLVWNGDRRELMVATDRFGMRPVYLARTATGLSIASEVKALLVDGSVKRQLSPAGLSQFFAFGHFLNDDTLFEGVRALPPATALTYRLDGDAMSEERYWRPQKRSGGQDAKSLMDGIDRALTSAVARRAGSNERLGLSLSAGLDARTILGLMPPGVDLQTVSLGIDGSMDHRGSTALAALAGVRHHNYVLDASFLAHFEEHLRSMVLLTDGHYLDQGIVMPTLPIYRDRGIEFLLRGHGGELLHMHKAYAYSLDAAALSASDVELERWLYAHLTGYMLQHVPKDVFTVDLEAHARDALRVAFAGTGTYDQPVDRVWALFLTERLHRETALSMHKFGCFATVRMPFVDNDVVDVLFQMPARMKLGDELQTEVLRRRRPAFLNVVNSNTGAKLGVGPIATEIARFKMRVFSKLGVRGYQPYERLGLWLKRELLPLVSRVLSSDSLASRGLFRAEAVQRVIDQHAAGQANHSFLLMSLVIFELGQQMLDDPERFAGAIAGSPAAL